MSDALAIPILKELVPEGIGFGSALMIEFEPDSLWHETSITIAAQALRGGTRTSYHTFQHPPDETRRALNRLGLDVKKLEEDMVFSILDSYTAQTGLDLLKTENHGTESLKLSDWSIFDAQTIKAAAEAPQDEKRGLHIDDNLGILLQYNPEKVLIDWFRTRALLEIRAYDSISFHSFVTGTASDAFYRQFEQLCDGIIVFKNEEREGKIKNYVRVRALRGKKFDSRWHGLEMQSNGEVTLGD